MRIDLAVPFVEKEQAKALGARWDPARKLWYVVDPADAGAFARWVKPAGASGAVAPGAATAATASAPTLARAGRGYITPRADPSLPDGPEDGSAPW